MDSIDIFCENLAKELRISGMKQRELANKVQCSEQTISAYIKTGLGKAGGKRPSFEMALLIADVFGASLDEMCGRTAAHAEATYTTLGDIVRELDKIDTALSLEPDMTSSVEIEPYGCVEVATLSVFDARIVSFYKERKRMDELLRDGVIDNSIYTTWLDAKMDKLNSILIDDEGGE